MRANLCRLQLQLVDAQALALQPTGADRDELFEALNVILNFRNGLGRHPADFLLDLLLVFDKFSVKTGGKLEIRQAVLWRTNGHTPTKASTVLLAK